MNWDAFIGKVKGLGKINTRDLGAQAGSQRPMFEAVKLKREESLSFPSEVTRGPHPATHGCHPDAIDG